MTDSEIIAGRRNRVLRVISQHGPITRGAIRFYGLSYAPWLAAMLDDLVQDGLIRTIEISNIGRGRAFGETVTLYEAVETPCKIRRREQV